MLQSFVFGQALEVQGNEGLDTRGDVQKPGVFHRSLGQPTRT